MHVWPARCLLLVLVANNNTRHHEGAWVSGGVIPHTVGVGLSFHFHYHASLLPEKHPPVLFVTRFVFSPESGVDALQVNSTPDSCCRKNDANAIVCSNYGQTGSYHKSFLNLLDLCCFSQKFINIDLCRPFFLHRTF